MKGPFDYRLSEEHPDVRVGALLRVPFGRRQLTGVVVEVDVDSSLAPERLLSPREVLEAAIPEDLVQLARWMAAEYCSTFPRTLALVLPPGTSTGTGRKELLVAEITAQGIAALDAENRSLSPLQFETLQSLHRRGPTTAATLGTQMLRRLEKHGLVTITPRPHRRAPSGAAIPDGGSPPDSLTAEQEQALGAALGALAKREHCHLLLHGVTGSGKTEVYLRAVGAALQAGLSAIVLVPEIGLTPQTLGRFQSRFGDTVAVLHSALGLGERHDEWLRLRGGEARVCIGPRSAVFAPLREVGLIVIDEEHDGSYKHDGDPRYDARTVALQRAAQHRAVVIAGSATPRPESAHSFRRLRLRQRIDGHPLPPVEVLDMCGQHSPLHPVTSLALADVRRARAKAIILLNRRGWSNFLSCRTCGHVWMCPNCDVALILHQNRPANAPPFEVTEPPSCDAGVACHHCGHSEAVPARCPTCASVAIARHGAGTQRLHRELHEALAGPGFPILRLDADATSAKGKLAATLRRFQAMESGVLVGTQMVAKGHDFRDVTLGVVVDADQTLRFPDFRAEERTFALITQLAGRAGRGDRGGRVLVQTLAPTARPIMFASQHDADGFLTEELKRRQALLYPPFGSLIRIVCSASEETDLASIADEIALRARVKLATDTATVLGPAPLFRLRGKARRQLLVKSVRRKAAIAAVGKAVELVASRAQRSAVSVSVDVDPQ